MKIKLTINEKIPIYFTTCFGSFFIFSLGTYTFTLFGISLFNWNLYQWLASTEVFIRVIILGFIGSFISLVLLGALGLLKKE